MFMRVDKLQTELPKPKRQDANAASALSELLGGKFGEMSTLNNYMFQSFNFRNKHKLKPFHSLVAGITAEELGHVELVSTGISMLASGPDPDRSEDVSTGPYADMSDKRNAAAFLHAGGAALPVDANNIPWTGANVFSTGNLVLDTLHNFFLECGARMHKLRVYETLTEDNKTGREVCGYLLVRGGVHAHAYALALKKLTGVSMENMLPVPNIPTDKIPECQKYLDEGSHRRLYRWSPSDFEEMRGIWGNGEQALPTDPPGDLEVVDGMPDGAKMPDLEGAASAFTPDYAPEEIFEIATKLYKKM